MHRTPENTPKQSLQRTPRPPAAVGSSAVRFLAVLAALGILLAALALWKEDALRSRWSRFRTPRVILVSLDTLNVLYTDVHHPGVGLTPELQAIAEAGVVFDRAYTPVSITLPAHASVLTGREPAALGVMVNGDQLDASASTLPEILHGAGYRTGAVVSLGVLKENFGLGQGFENYDDIVEAETARWYRYADEVVDRAIEWIDQQTQQQSDQAFFLWVHLSDPHEPYRERNEPADTAVTLGDQEIGRFALATKERHQLSVEIPPGRHELTWTSLRTPRESDRPATSLVLEPLDLEDWASDSDLKVEGSMLTDLESGEPQDHAEQERERRELFLFEPHTVLIENPTTRGATLRVQFRGRLNDPSTEEVREAYRAEVAYTDQQLARLRSAISERGLADGTLWVVVSDHGEGLGHHGILGHATYAQEDHMRSLFLLEGPGIPTGRRVEDAIVSLSDVAPTVLDVLGLSGLDAHEGASRTGCWSEKGCDGREEYWVYGASVDRNEIMAVAGYRGRHKVLWQKNRRFSIHDLTEDPTEETNLSELFLNDPNLRPRDVSKLGQVFEGQKAAFEKLLESRGQAFSPEHREMLESLGYL